MEMKITSVVRVRGPEAGALPFRCEAKQVIVDKHEYKFDNVFGPSATSEEIFAT